MRLAVRQHTGPERVTILKGDLYVGFGYKIKLMWPPNILRGIVT